MLLCFSVASSRRNANQVFSNRYLQELVGLYGRASQTSTDGGYEFEHEETDTVSVLNNGATVSESMRYSPISRTSSHDEFSDDVKTSSRRDSNTGIGHGKGSGHSTGKHDTVEFIQTGEFKFEPQLKVTGDATPWDWVEYVPLMILSL